MAKHVAFVGLLEERVKATLEQREKPEFEKMFKDKDSIDLGIEVDTYDDKYDNR